MGSQQLLFLVLVVIIVGIAVVSGIMMFRTQAMHSHRQSIVMQMNQYMVEAIAYKKLPTSMGGGSGVFWGYAPAGSESYRNHIGNPSNDGVRIVTDDVNYFIEWWVEGAYPQRVKIIASSRIYGEGNFWENTYNARVVASFDANGKVIYSAVADRNGFQFTGDWNR